MTSIRALAHTLCPTCNSIELHVARICQNCKLPNNTSGQAPVPKARPYGYATMKAAHFNAGAERAAARRRARQARARFAPGKTA